MFKFNNTEMRNDNSGQGHFGASRHHGTHEGVDLLYSPNESIRANIPLKYIRLGTVDMLSRLQLMEMQGTGLIGSLLKIKIMYVKPIATLNEVVEKDVPFALADDVAGYYGGSMKNHIHIETRFAGKLIDPKYIFKIS